MDQIGLDANTSLDDLKNNTAGKRQNKNKNKNKASSSSGSSVASKAFLNSRSSNLQVVAADDNGNEQKSASMQAVSTNNPKEINKRYNCITNDEKLKKECWRMREVHEDKMKEFEMQWINSSRRLNVPKDDNNNSSKSNSEGEQHKHKENSKRQQPVIVTSSVTARSGIEVMCPPNDDDLDDFAAKQPPQILIKRFTCMSPKSRRLKKEMKRMRKITLDSLSLSYVTTENDEHAAVNNCMPLGDGDADGRRKFMSRQDNVGQGLILSVPP